MNTSAKLNLSLFFIGLLGVLSLLYSPIPSMIPDEVFQKIPQETFRYLMLINPMILLLAAIFLGGYFAQKSGLDAPLIRGLLEGYLPKNTLAQQAISGIPAGLVGGFALVLFYQTCKPLLPLELIAMTEEESINLVTRFLYGGLTEEIIVRWGIMSLLVFIFWKLFSQSSNRPTSSNYWAGVFVAAIFFGLGHLPIVFATIGEVSSFLVFYIVTGNMIFGLIAGWLFWKKGLEAAMIAHVFGHVGMLTMGSILGT